MNTILNKRTGDLTEQEILGRALDAFQRETGLKAEKGQLDLMMGRKRIDATVRIEEPGGAIEYLAEVRAMLTETALGRLMQQFTETPGKWIVIARHIPMYLAKKMKELNIQFMDTTGNAYLNDPPLMIYMYGNRAEERTVERVEEGLLGVGGIRIIFALLCQRDLVNATYRDIAQAAGVALGTVAGIMKDLTTKGYLLELGVRGKKLTNRAELAEKWTTAYAEKFRYRKLIGKYTANRQNFWEDLQLTGEDALWGGEVAANKLTHYLKPAVITLYTHKPVEKLVLNLKLRKDEEGNVELRERFWRFGQDVPADKTVPALLVYADLLATADTRNIETAKMVYDQYLNGYFE